MDQTIVSAESSSALIARPRLSSRTVIFTNGPCLTLKSTIAALLGEALDVPVLATFQHGEVLTNGELDGVKRLDRYKGLRAEAEQVLNDAHSVILDGSFGNYARRRHVYELARRFHLHVVAIRTDCDDFDIIRARARRRGADRSAPDHAVNEHWFAPTRDEVRKHPIEDDVESEELKIEIIDVQTGRRPRVVCRLGASSDANVIAAVLQASGLLATRRAYASDRGECSAHPIGAIP